MTALHRHHLDGRLGPALPYVDTELVTPLPPADHARLHLLLGDLETQWPRAGEPILVHRARRHALTFGWAADAGQPLTFDPEAARALQRLWLDVLRALGGES